VLVGLFEEPERPPNAVEYIKRYLGASADTDVEGLRFENARLREENDGLAAENEELRARVQALEGKEGDAE
jgi:regulator of replication initiation timing